MKIRIGEQVIDAAICEGTANIADGTYPFVDIATAKGLTAAQMKQIKETGFEALDDIGAVVRSFSGYGEVHEVRTIFVKRENPEQALLETSARLSVVSTQKKAMALMLAPKLTDVEALSLGDVWPDWRSGVAYQSDMIVMHNGVAYRVVQPHTSLAHQPPDIEGMLAIYRPVQAEPAESEVLPWVSGEAVNQGETRMHQGVVYECTGAGGAGANVHSPDLAPSVWTALK